MSVLSPVRLYPSWQVKLQFEPKEKVPRASTHVMLPVSGNVMGEHFFTVVEHTVDIHQKKKKKLLSTVYYDSTFINIA